MVVHFFCFLGLLFVGLPFTKDMIISISRVFGILSMAAQVLSVSLVCVQMFTKVDQNLSYSAEFAKYHHWFQIEIAVTMAGVASIMLFLFIRSCFKQRGMQIKLGGCFEVP